MAGDLHTKTPIVPIEILHISFMPISILLPVPYIRLYMYLSIAMPYHIIIPTS